MDKPDDFERSGLWLLGGDDELTVADVGVSTAAEAAGLRAGDSLLSIGGEAVAMRGLPEWRQHLRESPVGTKLALSYLRAGKTQRTMLILAERIPAKASHAP